MKDTRYVIYKGTMLACGVEDVREGVSRIEVCDAEDAFDECFFTNREYGMAETGKRERCGGSQFQERGPYWKDFCRSSGVLG